MQNWNDGKAQEFKDRKVYDVTHSKLSVKEKNEAGEADIREIASDGETKKLLFTTKTCPNCVIAKKALNEAHMEYEVIDAEEHRDLARKYKIMQAPTLVLISDGGVEKLTNASNIKKYAEG